MPAFVQGLRGTARGLRSHGHPRHDPPDAPPSRAPEPKAPASALTFKTGSQRLTSTLEPFSRALYLRITILVFFTDLKYHKNNSECYCDNFRSDHDLCIFEHFAVDCHFEI